MPHSLIRNGIGAFLSALLVGACIARLQAAIPAVPREIEDSTITHINKLPPRGNF